MLDLRSSAMCRITDEAARLLGGHFPCNPPTAEQAESGGQRSAIDV
jgi:hypothetical protein